jgi:hypothetical protein
MNPKEAVYFSLIVNPGDKIMQSDHFKYSCPTREELVTLNDLWLKDPEINRYLNPNNPFPANFDASAISVRFNNVRSRVKGVRAELSDVALRQSTAKGVEERIKTRLGNFKDRTLMFSISENDSKENEAGLVGVMTLEVSAVQSGDKYKFVGTTRTVIDPNSKGKGVATEAKMTICDYAFTELGLDEVHSSVLPSVRDKEGEIILEGNDGNIIVNKRVFLGMISFLKFIDKNRFKKTLKELDLNI